MRHSQIFTILRAPRISDGTKMTAGELKEAKAKEYVKLVRLQRRLQQRKNPSPSIRFARYLLAR